ncbi:site-specific DNA-methyltransferase, partial [bacterium]|nr:site-specific DNA-methyltransferase [bacterium]
MVKANNKLYYGDNLEILRDKIPSETIDLIYLDPPFQSGKNYNTIFEPELSRVKGATAQQHAFEDTWRWEDGEAEREYQGLVTGTITKEKPGQKLIDLIKAMRGYLSECSMIAYLCMMAPRLLEMRRVLKETGSIYLHCDPTASHYLKLLMDSIFGVENFRNEIIWCYSTSGRGKREFSKKHDII